MKENRLYSVEANYDLRFRNVRLYVTKSLLFFHFLLSKLYRQIVCFLYFYLFQPSWGTGPLTKIRGGSSPQKFTAYYKNDLLQALRKPHGPQKNLSPQYLTPRPVLSNSVYVFVYLQ